MATDVEESKGTKISLIEIKKLRKQNEKLGKQLLKRMKRNKRKEKLNELSTNGGNVKREDIQIKEELSKIDGVEIEYVPAGLTELLDGRYDGAFDEIAKTFSGGVSQEDAEQKFEDSSAKLDFKEKEEAYSDDEEEGEEEAPKLSKKQLKVMKRPSVAQLKQVARRPEVVEAWDTTAEEPYYLVLIKSLRNTVSVPLHWNQKRKYMQGKRGIEKPPFKLPSYIEATKITEIRQGILEKEALKTLKQKQREKARPKSHRMDIDYQVLHDAFFKYASKPPLTSFGDIYFEGKENEMRMKQFKPGKLSDRAKQSLGMTENSPAPWLINMQRYGPPPSYPLLKIPGLNCHIPRGCEYGYHPGGWGKPPVDEYGNLLYGAIGLNDGDANVEMNEEFWGKVMSDDEAEEEEDIEEGEAAPQTDGAQTPATYVEGSETPLLEGIASVGATSITSGLETPLSLDIRKRGFTSAGPKPYTVLQQKEVPLPAGSLFPSNIAYKIPAHQGGPISQSSIGGAVTPSIGGAVTPSIGGMVTPTMGGMLTPFAGNAHPSMAGNYYPNVGGMATPSGIATPTMGGGVTPMNLDASRGMNTPSMGVIVNLNPNEMEQEGAFTADVIRQQLKQHEEQAVTAQRAAGQVDVDELRRQKAAGSVSTSQDASKKKKKKKEFKF